MLVSPINGVIIKLPFYSKWFETHMNGVTSFQSKFPVNSYCGFGVRFLNREQQSQYRAICATAKTILGVTAIAVLLKKLID